MANPGDKAHSAIKPNACNGFGRNFPDYRTVIETYLKTSFTQLQYSTSSATKEFLKLVVSSAKEDRRMSWQLNLSFTTTIPALLIATFLALSIFYRRYRIFQYNRQRYLTGPAHFEHSRCKCQCYIWERDLRG